ncbi:RidA family protein [Fusobacterium perfoetens]|uniref:RidA family protein n=1 Tax=Fusobacterium perfoetens TaxID=852 RepID=UPI0004801DEC|nr:RidA family protein [Fusobacterium perfoetens]MCI6153288.1 RidA family protein [Fusobacterium perfoetens]MDY3238389.1 RidA family protein [Fusobacterium perfoetens]
MDVYENLKKLNIKLLDPTPKGGIYSITKEFGNKLVYVSGTAPWNSVDENIVGKLGKDLTIEEGQEAARRCLINILSNLHHELGDLNKIKSFVKILGFVASAENFYEHPKVIDGASKLLKEIFGEEIGLPTRSAIGVSSLPWNIPVEIELILELK